MSDTRRVLKYGPLEIGEPTVVYMPMEAQLLTFSAQHGQHLFVWAEVDPDMPERGRHLLVVGTGHHKPIGGTHVGSWVSDGFVWHLFDYGGLPPVA